MDYGRLSIRSARGDLDAVTLARVNTGIGSDASNQVVLNGRGVAVFHCKLVTDEGGAELIDLGSNRGTLVNGNRVTVRRLSDGDKIAVGDYTLVYVAPLPGANTPRPAAAPAPEPTPYHPLPLINPPTTTMTPPEAAVRIVRGTSGPVTPRTGNPGDTLLRVPIPPTIQPTASATAEPAEVSAATWAADDITPPEDGSRYRPRSPSAGTRVDVERTVHLVVYEGAAPRHVPVDVREVVRIGTHVSCQCMLPYNRQVFPQHASLAMDKGQWMLRKLLPTARVRVDGQEVESAELRGGEVIHVGEIRLQFHDPSQPDLPLARRLGLGRPIPLSAPAMAAGRAADVLQLVHPQVSAHQARLEQHPQGWAIRDVGAVPALWVNKALVPQTLLAAHDIIAVGPFHYRFTGQALEPLVAPGRVCLGAVRARVEGGEGSGLSLVVQPHEMVALVHPTEGTANGLLSLLSGEVPLGSGYVAINGLRVAAGQGIYGAGRVRADAPLPADGAVRGYLTRMATLQAAPDLADVRPQVENALTVMDLGGCMDKPLSDLAADEAQRVRIAAALTACPLVLLLEDPCKGLDPMAASHLIERLREVADSGLPVVFTSSPARKLLWCDQVVLMASETQVAFVGPPQSGLRWLNCDAFIDAALRLSQEKTPGSWIDDFRRSSVFASFLEPRLGEFELLVGEATSARYRSTPWQVLPARRGRAELERVWAGFLEGSAWVGVAVGEAVVAGTLLSAFAPHGEKVLASLAAPLAAYWMVLAGAVWTWGFREGLRWPPAREGPTLERMVALGGQAVLSGVLLMVQTALLVGLLHFGLAFTPGAGAAMVVTLLMVAGCGFGGGVIARGLLPSTAARLTAAAWLIGAQALLAGSAEDPTVSLAVLNPLHDAGVLFAAALSGSEHLLGFVWMLPALLLWLGAATAIRYIDFRRPARS
ncbi:MAG TPA: FHA domain-containing protein [Candidatus Xenobia bacterium]|jgi:ABC-type multidrug transport system ATPase subunit/pSer/pThr/pTyr-binding forkhead associated (FHA) protein